MKILSFQEKFLIFDAIFFIKLFYSSPLIKQYAKPE
jgi:hypothetical protein